MNALHRGLLAPLLALSLAWAACVAHAAASDYRLGPGDLLKITTFGYNDLNVDARVSESGNITFPLIGQIAVDGLSTRDVESLIEQKLAAGAFIKQAQVSVLITEYQSQKVSVMGQVLKPGMYYLDGSTRVLDLLAKAGGVSEENGGDTAVLLRKTGTSQTIDLTALFAGDAKQNPVVANGDTINVPRAPRFYIYGEVQRPGSYRVERGMTLSRAISAGGGLTARGSERRVVVKRRDAAGHEKKFSIDGGDQIREDDVLFVKESLF